MALNKPYKVGRSRKNHSLLQVLLMLFAAAAIAFIVAIFWQMAAGEESILGTDQTGKLPSAKNRSEISDNRKTNNKPESNDASTSPQEDHTDEEQSSEPEEKKLPKGALPQSTPVESIYFDDAVFVGDSITEGMLIYSGMENARILAGTGVNFSTIYTTSVIKLEDGSRTTIMDELSKAQYKKVYVMLGGNEVRDMEKGAFLKRYEKVLDDVRAAQPDALIYVQSMTPVTEINNYKMDNVIIDEFNEAIMELCAEKQLYYLNVSECMKDERGMLPTEASPKDGMHFGQSYFDKWIKYLKTHTAQEV